MKRTLFLLLLAATPALAQGSNIGISQYPAPTCTKPAAVDETQKLKPPPEKFNDDQAIAYNKRVDAYNVAMRDYNGRLTAFNGCIQAYLANGNADMRRIKDALDAAVAAANAK